MPVRMPDAPGTTILESLRSVLKSSLPSGVERIIITATNLKEAREALKLARTDGADALIARCTSQHTNTHIRNIHHHATATATSDSVLAPAQSGCFAPSACTPPGAPNSRSTRRGQKHTWRPCWTLS